MVDVDDPFAVLGVDRDADEVALRAARRRLAKELHPDRQGGDATRMQRLNAAFDDALELVQRRQDPAMPAPADPPPSEPAPPRQPGRMAHDVASFTIEALPAEAFEALLIVATWLGEVLVDEPPYQLDVELGAPYSCWCRLDLVPDAGASTVALTLVATDVTSRPDLPDLDTVRDAWVTALNQLGRPD
ncbi:hypothetical protein BH18ACT2_BH18ACT2_09520 [soil metagenome]